LEQFAIATVTEDVATQKINTSGAVAIYQLCFMSLQGVRR